MSSLVPEHQISFSPSLAATIGLEEAILLQMLTAFGRISAGRQDSGFCWHEIELAQFLRFLPFWTNDDSLRIAKSLRDKGIVLLDSTTLPQGRMLRFAMNERNNANAAQEEKPVQEAAPPTPAPKPFRGANLLADNWQPDEDLLQLLALNHNIDRSFALAQVEDFVLYWRDRQQVSHSWPTKFRQQVIREWRHHQSRQHRSEQTGPINNGWQPSIEAMEILQRAEIDGGFIEDAIPEFVLYWNERGVPSDTWNSKFIAHIRRQWARFTATMKSDYEPRPIDANWQPNEDVFDIFRLANIDSAFAREQVAEFVLFWRDAGDAHRSWNSKFLQHVKYQWATRHHLGPHYDRQQNAHRSTQGATDGKTNSPFQRLTDRSWAEGIVEGI